MTSTRSSRKERTQAQFSRVYRWELNSTRMLSLFYTIATLVIMPGTVLMEILSNRAYYSNMANWEGETKEVVQGYFINTIFSSYNRVLSTSMFVLLCAFLFCFAGKSFGYMHTRRSVDLFHALPVKRAPLLMGKYLAGLTALILPQVVATALCQLVCVIYEVGVEPVFFWQRLGLMVLMTVAAFTFAMLFMVISGTLPSAYLSMLSLSLGWPFAVNVADQTMAQFLPGYVSVISGELYTLFCPFGALLQVLGSDYTRYVFFGSEEVDAEQAMASPWFIGWWIVLSVVMLVVALLYYNRRKSESAENFFSFPVIRGLIRGLLAMAVGLEAGLTLGSMLNSNRAFLGGILLGAMTTHIVYQFVLTHSFRGFWKTIPAFGVSMVVLGGFLYGLYTGGLGYVTRLPDPADVERVEFCLPTTAADGSKEGYFSQHTGMSVYDMREDYLFDLDPVFTKESDIAAMEEFHRELVNTRYPGPYLPFEKLDYSNYDSNIRYTMKDGSTQSRNYWFYLMDSDTELLQRLAEVQKLDTIQNCCPFYSMDAQYIADVNMNDYENTYEYNAYNNQLTEEEKKLVWDTFVEELNSSDFFYAPKLMTEEELELIRQRQNEDSSMMDGTSEDTSTRIYYYITVGHIPMEEVSPELKILLEQKQQQETQLFAGAPSYMTGPDFPIPECCVKTRQLIEELTEPYGQRYDYDEME